MGSLNTPPARAGSWSRRFSKLVMATLFRPMFGWRGPLPDELAPFTHVGGDGSRLAGALYESRAAHAKGVVILCHPFLKFGMHYFFKNQYHAWLAAAGYHVVGFHFKGFGGSTVESVSFAEDVISLEQWSRARYPGLPAHLLGISFGAFHAIHAIALGRARFDAVLFDSAPATLAHFFGSGIFGAVMRSLSRSRWSHVTGTKEIFRSLPLPAGLPRLFLYGARDRYITQYEVERVRQACGADHVRVFPGCGHLELRKAYPDDYAAAVTTFFDTHSAANAAPLSPPAKVNHG